MQSTETEAVDDPYFTAPEAVRRRLWWRFLGSLALFGFLIGMMIGRVTEPSPPQLQAIRSTENGVVLEFDAPVRSKEVLFEGSYALLLQASGAPDQGQLVMAGNSLVNWRVRPLASPPWEPQLVLGFIGSHVLSGAYTQQEVATGWQLRVHLTDAFAAQHTDAEVP